MPILTEEKVVAELDLPPDLWSTWIDELQADPTLVIEPSLTMHRNADVPPALHWQGYHVSNGQAKIQVSANWRRGKGAYLFFLGFFEIKNPSARAATLALMRHVVERLRAAGATQEATYFRPGFLGWKRIPPE